MRDPQRIEPMLAALRNAWYAHPDWRLGQLIANVCKDQGFYGMCYCDRKTPTAETFYIEDDMMREALQALVNQKGNMNEA